MPQHQLFYGSDFLIFDALTKKPRTTRELSQLLQIAQQTVAKRLKRFAECEPPLIIRRWPDRRWVPTVILRAETPRETAEALGGPVVIPPVSRKVEPQVVGGKVVNVEPTPTPTPEPEAVQKVPDSTLPPSPLQPYAPPPSSDASEKAWRVASKMRVPAILMEYGEVRVGRIGRCVKNCGRTSVLLYGNVNVCPFCARGGR
jgi:hypothetical protein